MLNWKGYIDFLNLDMQMSWLYMEIAQRKLSFKYDIDKCF